MTRNHKQQPIGPQGQQPQGQQQVILSKEEIEDLNIKAVAYGYPYVRFLLINELRDLIEAGDPSVTLQAVYDFLCETSMKTKLPMRDIDTSHGPMNLVLTTRKDTLLIAEPVSAAYGTEYPADHDYYKIQRDLLGSTVQELFVYITHYVYRLFREIEPDLYDDLCVALKCDRIIAVPEKSAVNEHADKMILSLGYVIDTEEMPKLSKYSLSPHLI